MRIVEPLSGMIDGRFMIDRVAATGGMGTVYRAYDTLTGDQVALKVLNAVGGATWRFAQEAEIARVIDHPFVVQYVAHGHTTDGAPYLALEWLDGEDLATRLSRGPLSLGESLQLVRRISRALSALHDSGIVHRDLKPANVFLRDGRVDRAVLLDFGVARMIRRADTDDVTGRGVSVGTPQYMAPEQVTMGAIDARTDVHALGTLLYECLTGAAPFASNNLAVVVLRILREPAPRLSDMWVEVSSELEAFCAQMLEKDPAKRPADARAVCEFVEGLMEREGIAPWARSPAQPKLRLVVSASVDATAPTLLESAARIDQMGARLAERRPSSIPSRW